MALTTYEELKATIADYLARTDLTAAIPDFITLAEAKFNRELRCNQMEKRSTATVDLSSDEPEFITLPSSFQTMRRIRLSSVDGKPRLNFKSGTQIDEYRYGINNVSGRPVYFTILGDELELCPTPDLAYTIEMAYRAKVPALSDSNTTNWLLALAPDAYLYGALLEASPYIQDDPRIAVWGSARTSAIDELNTLAQEQAYGAGPMEVRSSGYTP